MRYIMSQRIFSRFIVTAKSRISMTARCSDARWWMHQRDQSTGIYHSRLKTERNPRDVQATASTTAERRREKSRSQESETEKKKTTWRLDPQDEYRWDWIWQTRARFVGGRCRWCEGVGQEEGARGWSLVGVRTTRRGRRRETRSRVQESIERKAQGRARWGEQRREKRGRKWQNGGGYRWTAGQHRTTRTPLGGI